MQRALAPFPWPPKGDDECYELIKTILLTGLAAAGSFVVIGLTALEVVRRRHFEVFYRTHVLLAGAAGAALCLHCYEKRYKGGLAVFKIIFPAIALWLLDMVVRYLWFGFIRRQSKTAALEPLPAGVVKLSMPRCVTGWG